MDGFRGAVVGVVGVDEVGGPVPCMLDIGDEPR